MTKRGVDRNTIAPLPYPLFWHLGLDVRPLLFQSFASIVLQIGIYFSVLSIFIWLSRHFILLFREGHLDLTPLVSINFFLFVVFMSLVFGVFGAAYYKSIANSLKLPKWEDYTPFENDEKLAGINWNYSVFNVGPMTIPHKKLLYFLLAVCLVLVTLALAVFSGVMPGIYYLQYCVISSAGLNEYKQGHYGEAEKLLSIAAKQAEAFGPHDERLISSLYNLANLYKAEGKYEQADALHKRS